MSLALAVRDLRSADPGTRCWLASRRLQTLLENLPGAAPLPLAACAAIEEAEDTLDAWWAALDPVLAACRELWRLYPDESGVVHRRLWPPDRPVPLRSVPAPMHYLPLPVLTEALNGQLLQLRLRVALMAALAQLTDELETLKSSIGRRVVRPDLRSGVAEVVRRTGRRRPTRQSTPIHLPGTAKVRELGGQLRSC